MAYQRVEVLTGSERRRAYTPAEKAAIVAEVFRPGMVAKEVARRLGVHESLPYRWRRALALPPGPAAQAPAFLPVAVVVDGEPGPGTRPGPAEPPLAPTPDPAVSVPPAVLEVTLPGGARVSMRGAVDPALAAGVLAALSGPGRRP